MSHNLRTVVLDPQGRIFRQLDGNEWTPRELADAILKAARVQTQMIMFIAEATSYFDTGFNFPGFIPGRLLDTSGIAVARSNFSHDFSDSQVAGDSNPATQETVIEATYKVQFTPWWMLKPDFQYIFNPSDEQGSHDATILRLRTTAVF